MTDRRIYGHTKAREPVTDRDVERLAREPEAGYDVDALIARRNKRGRAGWTPGGSALPRAARSTRSRSGKSRSSRWCSRTRDCPRDAAKRVAHGLAANPTVFLRTKVQKELGLSPDVGGAARGDALVVGLTYMGAAVVPLWARSVSAADGAGADLEHPLHAGRTVCARDREGPDRSPGLAAHGCPGDADRVRKCIGRLRDRSSGHRAHRVR